MDFLDATEAFHEKLRLFFYPEIFEDNKAEPIDWKQFEPEYSKTDRDTQLLKAILPLVLATVLLILISIPRAKRL